MTQQAQQRRETEADLLKLAQDEGHHAVSVHRDGDAEEVPVVFDSPHSGRYYPEDFMPAVPIEVLREYEDRFVDRLIADAPACGVTLVVANFPRAYIDPNRAPDDIDAEMLQAVWPEQLAPTRHSAGGTGLIFRVMRDASPIYDRSLAVEEVKRRLEVCWRPYHAELDSTLGDLQRRYGKVWHVNCHSMRPIGDDASPDPGQKRADFALGDLFGTSCDPDFTAFVAGELRKMGYSVAINDPYSGAYIVAKHGRPGEGRHSLQIEINRGLYMNLDTLEESAGFAGVQRDLGRLAEDLADFARDRLSVV